MHITIHILFISCNKTEVVKDLFFHIVTECNRLSKKGKKNIGWGLLYMTLNLMTIKSLLFDFKSTEDGIQSVLL